MQTREAAKTQTLEEMVNDLFPKSFLDLSLVPTHLARVDQTTLLQLLADFPSVQLKVHFNLAANTQFLNALRKRNISLTEHQIARLKTIPKDIFARLILASKNISHLSQALNIDDKTLGRFIKNGQFLDSKYIEYKRHCGVYSTYKYQLLIEHGLIDPILEEHVKKPGSSETIIKAIAEDIGFNEHDTYYFVKQSKYWEELKSRYVKPLPIPPDTTYLAYVTLAKPKESAEAIPLPFSITNLDDECPMFDGALVSISQSIPVVDAFPVIDASPQWVEEAIAKIATTFQQSVANVKTYLTLSTSAREFRMRMGKDLENSLLRFFETNNLSYLELKTGKKIHDIRKMITSLYHYDNGEIALKNNFPTFARDLGVSEPTLKDYLKVDHQTSFARIIIEDLTPSCLFAIFKAAKGNKPKLSIGFIAHKLACASDSLHDLILDCFGISFNELADKLLPAISNENFWAISEKYTSRIGEMTQVQRHELIQELRRLATTAPRISVFSQQRPDVENPQASKARRIVRV